MDKPTKMELLVSQVCLVAIPMAIIIFFALLQHQTIKGFLHGIFVGVILASIYYIICIICIKYINSRSKEWQKGSSN